MIKKEVAKLLVKQINLELHSGYLYMDFANFYEEKKLSGFASWYMKQAGEEYGHAMKIRSFLVENGEKVSLTAIADPTMKFADLKAPLVEGLKHEQFITDSINKILDKAIELKDYLTVEFLQWFVKEQGEEEANAQENVDKFELIGGSGNALYMLNRELGGR